MNVAGSAFLSSLSSRLVRKSLRAYSFTTSPRACAFPPFFLLRGAGV